MMNEQQWINSAVQGDVAAFNNLVTAYQGTAYRVALRMLRDADAASDATQDAFISAYKHLGTLRGEFRPWLLRIVANYCYGELRRSRRHPLHSLDAAEFDQGEPTLAALPSNEESPFEFAARRELDEVVENGLDSLPPEMRLTLILVDVEGYSYEETAKIMETNSGTVKSRLARARGRMRDYLVARGAVEASREKTRAAPHAASRQTAAGSIVAEFAMAIG